jgi:hypothetical protein
MGPVNLWGNLPAAIRYPLAFAVPALATLFLTPVAGRAAHRFGVLDRPGRPTARPRRIWAGWPWPRGSWSSPGWRAVRTASC